MRLNIPQPLLIDACGLAVAALLAVCVYFVGVAPLIEQHHVQQQRLDELSERRQAIEARSQALHQLRAHHERARQALAERPLRLQPLGYLNQRVAAITSLADQIGLRIERIDPREPVSQQYYRTLPIDLAGEGPYQACNQFLHRLKHELPDMGVRSLTLEGEPGQAGAPTSFRLQLVWYAAREEEG